MKPYTSIYSKGIEGYTSFIYDYKSDERGMMGFSKTCTKGYRFGFNGQENDKETYGEGNAYVLA